MYIILFEMSFHIFHIAPSSGLGDWVCRNYLFFSECRFSQRNRFCFRQKHSSYLEYFQKENVSFGYHLVFCGSNI